jgi:hypothetical protein
VSPVSTPSLENIPELMDVTLKALYPGGMNPDAGLAREEKSITVEPTAASPLITRSIVVAPHGFGVRARRMQLDKPARRSLFMRVSSSIGSLPGAAIFFR